METTHTFVFQAADDLGFLSDESVNLVVTSPPYPMIKMWDESFAKSSAEIVAALEREEGKQAFSLMHDTLDRIWRELYRVVTPGGMVCINIGDAVRSLAGEFQLYNNHSRILGSCLAQGFCSLPSIIWHKPTNAPNKFMGSGMLPGGAYVTLEHEHILILRKGGKRVFRDAEDRARRRRSAYFWEERNQWFSDQWQVRGTSQRMHQHGPKGSSRERSGAYPFAIPFRLINMYSMYGDVVLDPFSGTGTTSQAALASGRHSVGVEIDPRLDDEIVWGMRSVREHANHLVAERIRRHLTYVEECHQEGRELRHSNGPHGFEVATSQERDLQLYAVDEVDQTGDRSFRATYLPAETHLYMQGDLF